jgi:hypothetical protein
MIQHYWRDVPGWFNGGILYSEQVGLANDGAIFVEIGSWKGRSTSFMGVEIANSKKDITFWAIDTWQGSPDEVALINDPDVISNRLYEVFCENILPVRQFIKPIISDSADAAERFYNDSIDFLYLDAAHDYDGVFRDLTAWWPKLKCGGTIAGDDWCWSSRPGADFTVRRAVELFFSDKKVKIKIARSTANI